MTVLKLIANKGFISYNKTIARHLGVNEAILLGELCSIFDYFNYNEFYISQERIANDTALSVKQIRTSLLNLEKAGVITITKKGQPCKNWYFINEDVVTEILETTEETDEEPLEEDVQSAQTGELDVPKVPNKIGKNVTTRCAKKEQLLINNNTDNNTSNNNINSSGCATKKKQKVNYELFLNSLDSKDNEVYRKCAETFTAFKKSINSQFTPSKATILKWQYDFALYSQKKSVSPQALFDALTFAINDDFWKQCLFTPNNLCTSFEKIQQKMHFSKKQTNSFYKGFDKESLKDKDFFSDLEEFRNGTTN